MTHDDCDPLLRSFVSPASSKKEPTQRQLEKAAKAGGVATAAAGAAAGVVGTPTSPTAASGPAATAQQPADNATLPSTSPEHRIDITEASLRAAGIPFTTYRHAAADTVEALLKVTDNVPGGKCKNLFLKVLSRKTKCAECAHVNG